MNSTASVPPELLARVTASPDADLLLSTDLRIVAASKAYEKALGAAPESLVGRDIRHVLRESPALGDLVASLEAAIQTGYPQRLAAETIMVTKADGQRQALQFEVISAPVASGHAVDWILHSIHRIESGRPDGQVMEAALQAAEARLRSILETVPDAMIIIDERGRIESLSSTAEGLFGYKLEEVAGKNVSMFMPSPHREQHDSYLERYLKTGERHIIGIGRIVVGQRRDGTTFPMHLTIGELRTGEKHYFTGFIRDLTDQQLTESRLKDLQSEVTHMSRFTALGEMASTLAHEINQPLTAINNYLRGSQRLLERIEGEPAVVLRDALGKAADQALRAGQIIRRLREFVARGESERRIENLPKLIEDASTLALIGAKENGIAVSFRLDPQADLVLADRIQIQQVLVNLIRNAIDVLVESSGLRELDIETVANPDSTVQISVADTGSGLAPEVAANLFQPFLTTKQKGMGLGLSICRTIVEAHGGRIWVDSRPEGGTIFRFTLRAANEEDGNLAQ
ncbi:two-component system, LuxR family, sensor kinase FixL [Enhydrobacter aerosaccus]|uniref:Sensor protein FixL n=1 Tax=Enhydrobacter aerosaccus TaxID=225324 RepID=A0A1T4R0X6_9HYPH|nr:PAS domain S-box protein [Enhydrobacter aerosaccus]SKA09663.1 two-component system, LuxR family, sensor kinase FixL [Enhydrobacter aerosaccus]